MQLVQGTRVRGLSCWRAKCAARESTRLLRVGAECADVEYDVVEAAESGFFGARSAEAGDEGAGAADEGEYDGGVLRRIVAAGLGAQRESGEKQVGDGDSE